ncbi:MAG: adenine phosphoribosyltransferase [Ruminococcus sp.]|nr:adenine phosphoribosyltransferase [Ruminococcus sp.]
MTDVYKMKIAGLERELRLCPINEKIDIAAFIMFSDVEITVESAKLLLERAPEFDVILTAESKGIPLAYEMARQSGKPYVVARKSVKLYMRDVVSVTVQSITTAGEQVLYLDGEKAAMLKGKRVLLADDVISTGESLNALEKLTAVAGGEIVGKTAVLAEGEAAERKDLIFLEPLPLFFKD